jgi:NCS2 family nucleobase:cation symporter-2
VPPHAAGVIIIMIGASVGSLGAADVLGAEGPRGLTLLVSTATLTTMLVAAGSQRPVHRAFAALIGLLAGWLLAAVSGVAPVWSAPASAGGSRPWLSDWSLLRVAFRADLLLLFGIAAVTTAVRVAADIATCARQPGAPAAGTDPAAATAHGVLANGLTTLLSGMLGSLGVGTSTANVALARATGVRSRRVGYVIGAIFVALAFLPGPASFLLAMPPTLTGPALIYVACFIVMNGVSLIAASAPPTRTPVGIGLPFLAGLVALSHPAHAAGLPPVVQAAAGDPLTVSTLTALAISGIATIARRVGAIAQSVRSTVVSGAVTVRRLRRWSYRTLESEE